MAGLPLRMQAAVWVFLTGLSLSAGVMADDALIWRQVDPENLVYMDIGEGTVVMELNPRFAPATVKQFKRLVKDDFYRGLSFYRVIEGFVAQAGNESDLQGSSKQPSLPPEFDQKPGDDWPWASVQTNDLFAPETGFVDGFAAARDTHREWLTHCPGVVAMARGEDPGSGSTDFYIVIGEAPRYLDRNLTIFGRVIDGMDVVQGIHRGRVEDNGIIEDDLARSRIKRMRLAEQLDDNERMDYYMVDTNSPGFEQVLEARRNRTDKWFHHTPPRVLDVCQVPVRVRIEPPPSQVPEQLREQ